MSVSTSSWLKAIRCFLSFLLPATVVKTEAGSLPEGKVKIRLEDDGTILDVDKDDVEKVRRRWLMVNGSAPAGICSNSAAPTLFIHTSLIL